jgi:perosamine synthetase
MSNTSDAGTLAIVGGDPIGSLSDHVKWPEILDSDRAAMDAAIQRGDFSPHAREVIHFETSFEDFSGASYCLALDSGTAALRCGLAAVGVGPGTEVITTPVSFPATAMAVSLLGARPVFVDIRPDTFTMDWSQVDSRVTPRTRAVLPVAMHGLFVDSHEIEQAAKRHGLAVVWDVAHAVGSADGDSTAGTTGTASIFSTHVTKMLQTIKGGLLTCNDQDTLIAARRFANFGEDRPPLGPNETRSHWCRTLGDNLRMTVDHAALGLAQLARLSGYQSRARSAMEAITATLDEIPGVSPQYIPDGCTPSPWHPRITLDPRVYKWDGPATEFRDRVIAALRAEGLPVETWQRYPLPALPAFRRALPVAWHPGMQDSDLWPWVAEETPVARDVLDSSITIAMHPYHLWVQPDPVIRHYREAFVKVFTDIDIVMTCDYEPVRVMPPIPLGDLP